VPIVSTTDEFAYPTKGNLKYARAIHQLAKKSRSRERSGVPRCANGERRAIEGGLISPGRAPRSELPRRHAGAPPEFRVKVLLAAVSHQR
jgi:hypothetical protein